MNLPKVPHIVHVDAIPRDTVLLGYRGSVSHGTYTPKYGPNEHDDVDLIGTYIAPENYYFGFGKKDVVEKVVIETDSPNKTEWDVVSYEIKKFFSLLLAGNPNVMCSLWLPSEMYIIRSSVGDRIIKNREMFISKNIYNSFAGYAKGQMYKMEHKNMQDMGTKRKGLVEKYGYNTKNASHMIRLMRMLVEFLSTGSFNVVRSDASELIDIKNGRYSLEQVKSLYEELLEKSGRLMNIVVLPAEPNREKAENLLLDILHRHFACNE